MKCTLMLGCGVLASALFVTTDIIGANRYKGYSLRDQNFSELTAEGSPVRSFMVAANCLPYASLLTVFGQGVRAAEPGEAGRRTGALLVAYGLANAIGGVVFPMAQRPVLAANAHSPINAMHIPVMGIMSAFLLLGLRSASVLSGKGFRAFTNVTTVALVLPAVLMAPDVPKVARNEPTPYMGALARINIYATALWIAALGLVLMRDEEER